jgi:5'-nucleotidase
MAGAGHEVLAVAPSTDHSGASSAIGPMGGPDGVAVEEVELDGLPGVPAYGVDAPPALAVMIARLGAFGDSPDLVVSGINPGPNTGRSVMHSGTVGAALTAANFGVSALAVSINTGEPTLFDTAGRVAVDALSWLVAAPPKTVLNINVPNLPAAELLGVRPGRLAPFGTVRAALGERAEGRLEIELRNTEQELDPDTDTALVLGGYVSVTPLVGIRAVDDIDPSAAIAEALGLTAAASSG